MRRVYLSGMFKIKDKIKKYSEELAELGVEPTSTWVGEEAKPTTLIGDVTPEYLRQTAIIDIKDLLNADTLVMITPTQEELDEAPKEAIARGGRHFELGYFYALVMFAQYLPLHIRAKREVILVGKRENVFHFLDGFAKYNSLPNVKLFERWDEAKSYLTGETANVRSEEVVETSETTQSSK